LLVAVQADAIHANDWEALPIAVTAAKQIGAKVILDLHEYAPSIRENRRYWKLFYKPAIDYFLKKYLANIDASVTVNQIIADRYNSEYNIQPIVVTNAPKRNITPDFKPTAPDQVQLIHHGNADQDRKLELLIETVALCDARYTLHLMLVERSRGYIKKLRELAHKVAPNRVFFHPPVPPNEIVKKIAEFDLGFYLLPAVSFNQQAASPNKFFDFIMAGLALCIGPSLEMARLTQHFKFGVVAPALEPKEVAGILNSLNATEIDEMKKNAIQARRFLNADIELGKLVSLYHNLFSRPR
jgi:hypothetical protein